MQPAKPARRIVLGGISWLVAAAALAGCSFLEQLPGRVVGPLVTVQMRGGLCPEGPCDRTITLERDGRVRSSDKPPNDLGRVPANALATLDAAIRSTDFAAMRSKKFTGVCPVAFDGQELVFEFGAPGGTQRLASCEVEIDWSSPLFVALASALGTFISVPPS